MIAMLWFTHYRHLQKGIIQWGTFIIGLFTEHSAFWTHPFYSMCQNFIPFYHGIILSFLNLIFSAYGCLIVSRFRLQWSCFCECSFANFCMDICFCLLSALNGIAGVCNLIICQLTGISWGLWPSPSSRTGIKIRIVTTEYYLWASPFRCLCL